jgi:hypothetical protein
MMKFVISVVSMMALSFATGLYLPWWTVAPVCFIVAAVISLRRGIAFLAGFLAIFLLWGGMSFLISLMNEHILAHNMSILILKKDSPILLVLLTGAIGGFVGGFAALSGSLVRKRQSA